MAMIGQHSNAEASSSSRPMEHNSSIPRRDGSTGVNGGGGSKRRPGNLSIRTISTGGGTLNQVTTPHRKVRTVPPSARFDPPTPPSPDEAFSPLGQPALPSALGANSVPGTANTMGTQRKRPQPKLRYSTSSESEADESEDSDSDDDPPWWTFTQRGMMKMRARSLRRPNIPNGVEGEGVGRGGGEGTEVTGESGVDSGRDKGRIINRLRPSSRKGSKELGDKEDGTPAPSITGGRRRNRRRSTSPVNANDTPDTERERERPNPTRQMSKLLHPAPIRMQSATHFFRRASPRDIPPVATSRLIRRNSDPGSPILVDPHVETIAAALEVPRTDSPAEVQDDTLLPSHENPLPQRQSTRRQLTAPAFTFRKRLSDPGENLTDSEAHMMASPRLRAKAKRMGGAAGAIPIRMVNRRGDSGGGGGGQTTEDDAPEMNSTPNGRPGGIGNNRRKQTNRIRLNLPPPITHHFSHGWPHAGSWQDALYGTYDDEAYRRKVLERQEKKDSQQSRKNSSEAQGGASASEGRVGGPTPARSRAASRQNSTHQSASGHGRSPANDISENLPSTPQQQPHSASTKRGKSRKRRYRQALAPPTPRGLGFTPADDENRPHPEAWKEGRVRAGSEGFDWGHGDENGNGHSMGMPDGTHNRIEEGDELSRSNTRATTIMTEKDPEKKKKKWGRGSNQKHKIPLADRRSRWRRTLFLDARVTIYIRLLNLAVVAALLGISITIRLELYQLRLPGLIGASTTLIISYASLTIAHALSAIYREYFGKPIGLWGLRSKMLFVCMDLLFVAFWASALTLATNDYIATPLECTDATPWWRSGLAQDYADLLQDLARSGAGIGDDESSLNKSLTLEGVTSVEMITSSLGVVLPVEIVTSGLAGEICRRQVACISLSVLAVLLYAGNMVFSLFRIFEVVRRSADVGKAVMV